MCLKNVPVVDRMMMMMMMMMMLNECRPIDVVADADL